MTTNETWLESQREGLRNVHILQNRFPLSSSKESVRKPDGIKKLMEKVGFSRIEIREEMYEFGYADENQWWQAKWIHGARYPLEQMGEDVLKKFKEEVFIAFSSGVGKLSWQCSHFIIGVTVVVVSGKWPCLPTLLRLLAAY